MVYNVGKGIWHRMRGEHLTDTETGFDWNRILAMSLLAMIPSLAVFFLAQDSFVDGIAAGGVKG